MRPEQDGKQRAHTMEMEQPLGVRQLVSRTWERDRAER